MMGSSSQTPANQAKSIGKFPALFSNLQSKLNKDASSLLQKIQRAIIGDYSHEQMQQIRQLIEYWSRQYMKLEELMAIDELFSEKSYNYYLSIDCLAARVYLKITDYFVRVRSYNDMEQQQKDTLKEFRHLLNKEELVFSYDRFFWGRRTVKNKFYSEQNEKERISVIKNSLKNISEMTMSFKNNTLYKVFQFMQKLQIINFQQNTEVKNRLVLKLQNISKQDQKIQFLHSLQASYLQGLYDITNNQIKSLQQKKQTQKIIKQKLANYHFYSQQNQKRSIYVLHEKIGDYKFLQQRHDYIQWMFPNHYGSAFNSKSSPLSYLEKRLFIDDITIGFLMLKSIYQFFDFMGIRINLKDLSLQIISRMRLRAVILVNFHNHLRIMRILACLSVIGFRKLAINLIEFLDKETSPNNILSKERQQFEKSWSIYGDESAGVPKKKAKQMCFLEDDKFPQDHSILKLLHTLTIKQPVQQTLDEIQKNQGNVQDLQQFNPPKNHQNQISVNKIEKDTHEKEILAEQVQKDNFNLISVEQDGTKKEQIVNQSQQKNEISSHNAQKLEDIMAQKVEPQQYLPPAQGEIAAANITATSK